MKDANQPYAAPESTFNKQHAQHEEYFTIHAPQTAPLGRGVGWLSESFDYFKASAGGWIITCLVGLVIMVVLSIVPGVNFLMSVATYCWLGGLMIGCKAQYDGEPFELSYLFRGFQDKLGPLLALGGIMLLANVAAMLVSFGAMAGTLMGIGGGDAQEEFGQLIAQQGPAALMLPILIYLALIIPLTMLVWFAPALICLGDVSIFQAMRLSFAGCLKNILPMFIYSLVLIIAMIVASIPIMLGWFVLGPMIYISVFLMFKDIYVEGN